MRRSLPKASESSAFRGSIRHVTETRRSSMLPSDPSYSPGQPLSSAKGLGLTFIAGAALLLAACGKDQPSLGGRADTAASGTTPQTRTSEAPGQLAYVTNEDSQELSVIDTRTDSVVAQIQVGTRPRGVKVS